MSAEVRRLVEAGDWKAQDRAREAGPGAAPVLIELAGSPRADTRALALAALAETRSDAAPPAFLAALDDPDLNVRRLAIVKLEAQPQAALVPKLFEKLDSNPDSYVRERIPIAIARTGSREAIPELRRRADEDVPDAMRKSLRLALAILREEPWLEETFAQLEETRADLRVEGLRDVQVVADAELVRRVKPLLDDAREVFDVGPAPMRNMIRVCDVAVNVVGFVGGRSFSFDPRITRRFKPEELAEVRRSLE